MYDKLPMGWYNFKTEETEYMDFPPDERLTEFMPQFAAPSMYATLLELGKTPQEAYMQVLDACCNQSPKEDC